MKCLNIEAVSETLIFSSLAKSFRFECSFASTDQAHTAKMRVSLFIAVWCSGLEFCPFLDDKREILEKREQRSSKNRRFWEG